MILLLGIVAVPTALAKTATLAWDANEEPDLEGYVVHRNTGSPGPPYKYSDEVLEEELVDPLHPKAELTGLQEGTQYYVALTAYNSEGVESSFSEDVCVKWSTMRFNSVDRVHHKAFQRLPAAAAAGEVAAVVVAGHVLLQPRARKLWCPPNGRPARSFEARYWRCCFYC